MLLTVMTTNAEAIGILFIISTVHFSTLATCLFFFYY